jgi:uncharacterized membrane-anchored protein
VIADIPSKEGRARRGAPKNEMDVTMTRPRLSPAARLERLAAKVPEITAIFWVLKVLTTGMGEAMSDYLGEVSIVLAAAIGVLGLALALRLQLGAREYRARVYWFTVMMVAVFGTMVADGIRDGLHVPYAVTTVLYGLGTAGVFGLWYRREGTLSIHTITTRSRELFYWVAVLGTFALGTAAGDLTASQLKLGYLGSIALFAVAISLPAIGWLRLNLNPVIAFWGAYILTRPLGASVADWLGKPRKLHTLKGGLAYGDGTVSALALLLFVALVAYVAIRKPDIQRAVSDEPRPHGARPHLEPAVEGAAS